MKLFISASITLLAYIDPGVGSMIFQVLIAGFVVIGFIMKVFWARIKSFFAKLFRRNAKKEVTDLHGQSAENK
jgi:hypothetical protein